MSSVRSSPCTFWWKFGANLRIACSRRAFNCIWMSASRRASSKASVTLMELMDGFDEARREADIQMQLNALREQAIRRFAPNFHQKVHGEDLTEDIALTWQRLAQFNGEPIPLRSLTVGDVWDEVTVFMSLLFLAHLEKVKLWQKDYPYGEIFVRRLSMEVDLPTEELLAIPVLGPKPIGTPEA